MVLIEGPASDECSAYYMGYAARVPDGDVLALLDEQIGVLGGLLRDLSDGQAEFRFAPDEWSIKEVAGHLVDAERILSYRAFTIARDEAAVLPGFEPDDYVRAGQFGAWSLAELLDELTLLRRANLIAFRHLTPEASQRRGDASGTIFSVRALVYIIAGHINYHLEDLREKYLPGLAGD
jgi:DinB superfamily